MTASLLDVNVLVALAWPNHVHHELAHRWFRRLPGRRWATAAITQSGFLRVSSNRAANPHAVTPREALELLRRMCALPGHEHWSDDIDLARLDDAQVAPLVGHRQVADLHLVALARARGGRLATLDRALGPLAGKDAADVVQVIL